MNLKYEIKKYVGYEAGCGGGEQEGNDVSFSNKCKYRSRVNQQYFRFVDGEISQEKGLFIFICKNMFFFYYHFWKINNIYNIRQYNWVKIRAVALQAHMEFEKTEVWKR